MLSKSHSLGRVKSQLYFCQVNLSNEWERTQSKMYMYKWYMKMILSSWLLALFKLYLFMNTDLQLNILPDNIRKRLLSHIWAWTSKKWWLWQLGNISHDCFLMSRIVIMCDLEMCGQRTRSLWLFGMNKLLVGLQSNATQILIATCGWCGLLWLALGCMS